MSDQGTFPNYGPNDENGYPLPSHEQYMSRFPLNYGWQFSSAVEGAPQGDGSDDSYEELLSRPLLHNRPLINTGEVMPSDNAFGGDNWAFSHPDNFFAYQPAGPHPGSSHNAPTNSGLASVAEHAPYYRSDVRTGGFSTVSVRDQRPQMAVPAPQQGNDRGYEVQAPAGELGWIYPYPGHFADFQPMSDGRPAYGPTLHETYASYVASTGNAQYPPPSVCSSYTGAGNAQCDSPRGHVPSTTPRQANSPAVRPRGPVGPSVEATRFPSQPSHGTRSLQRAAGLRGAGHPSPEAAPNPSQQSSNGTPSGAQVPRDAQHMQALMRSQMHAMEQSRSLVRRTMMADTHRKPPAAPIIRCTVLLALDPSHDPECPICQDPYDDNEHVATTLLNTVCNHVFGRNCLQEWVNSGMDNAHRCPNCRQSIVEALDIPKQSTHAAAEDERMRLMFQPLHGRPEVRRLASAPQPPQPRRRSVVAPRVRLARQQEVLRRREMAAAEHRRRLDAEAVQEATRRQARAQEEAREQQQREARQGPSAPTRRPTRSLQSLPRSKTRWTEAAQRQQQEFAAREANRRRT
jgi:hypothetical protein